MKRYGSVIKVKPEKFEEYKKLTNAFYEIKEERDSMQGKMELGNE